jgi:hypothetical protein
VSGTVGILVGSAVTELTGTQILGNQVSNEHFGIWTMLVQSPASLTAANHFINVQIPVHQQ